MPALPGPFLAHVACRHRFIRARVDRRSAASAVTLQLRRYADGPLDWPLPTERARGGRVAYTAKPIAAEWAIEHVACAGELRTRFEAAAVAGLLGRWLVRVKCEVVDEKSWGNSEVEPLLDAVTRNWRCGHWIQVQPSRRIVFPYIDK